MSRFVSIVSVLPEYEEESSQFDVHYEVLGLAFWQHLALDGQAWQTPFESTIARCAFAGRTSVRVGELRRKCERARPKLRSETHRLSVRQQFELHLKDWLLLPLDEITKSMAVAKHRSLAKTPSAANHTLKYFRTVWNHARRVHDLPECPTMAIEWFEEKPSGEIIEDLRTWRQMIEDLQNPIHKVFFELLLFTGFRKTEALTLEWKNVHEDYIHLPMTKNGRSFDLPILQLHHEILSPVRGLSRQWVFPSPKSPSGHLTNPQRLQWTIHSHRRTFATVAMEAGVLEEIVGRLLNHTPLSITGQRYVKPSLDALRPAMETVCKELKVRAKDGPIKSGSKGG